jgi:hypothetical protein
MTHPSKSRSRSSSAYEKVKKVVESKRANQHSRYQRGKKPAVVRAPSYQSSSIRRLDGPIPDSRSREPERRLVKVLVKKPLTNVIDRRSSQSSLDRQGLGAVPDFAQGSFNIPSSFRKDFREPEFAQFRPPFGQTGSGFADFLKTVGGGSDSFFQSGNINFAAAKKDHQITDRRFTEDRLYYPTKSNYGPESRIKPEEIIPSVENGFFSNDYVQDFSSTTRSTTTRTTTTTTRRPTTTTSYPNYPQKTYYNKGQQKIKNEVYNFR